MGSLKKMSAEDFIIAYGRFTKTTATAVVINRDTTERTVTLAMLELIAPQGVKYERIVESTEKGYNVGKLPVPLDNGKVTLKLAPMSAVVIRSVRDINTVKDNVISDS